MDMKILLIQTAFIGDVVLATPLIEKLKATYPEAQIDFLVRKGNESLLKNHPYLRNVLIFNKKSEKYKNLVQLIYLVRAESYDVVINVQRFFTTGLLTALSGAKRKIGFQKNPLSMFFDAKIPHEILTEKGSQIHEVHRNLALLESLTDTEFIRPKLYPSASDFEKVKRSKPYICIAPASVWATKKFPPEKWCELIRELPSNCQILLLGGSGDVALCQQIREQTDSERVEIWAGKLSFLESVALIQNAKMTFTNDSAPLHFASAVNAPVSAIFCSTVPSFGFYPLSDISHVFETDEKLNCRPCGLHGKKGCPLGHFKCGKISIFKMIQETGLHGEIV